VGQIVEISWSSIDQYSSSLSDDDDDDGMQPPCLTGAQLESYHIFGVNFYIVHNFDAEVAEDIQGLAKGDSRPSHDIGFIFD
jgi:hypothetical protein